MKPNYDDPHAQVKRFSDYDRDINESCDFLVVGSGPAGSVAALELSRAGYSVVLLEEGPPLGPKDFVTETTRHMRNTLREAGLRASMGNIAMPNMQPICLGGGSLVNSAMCVRSPKFVFERWRREHGIDWISREALDPHYQKIYDYWPVAPTPMDIMGRRNLVFKEGCDNLGISSEPADRNVVNCRACAECFTCCPTRAKRSTDITFIPDAITAGAKVYANMRAEELIIEGRRVAGVRARAFDHLTNRKGPALQIRAKCTVLAAGVIGTPLILLKNNNAANSSGMVGKNLIFHPGAAVAGIFDEVINPWEGATQGYHSLEYIEQGYKLEVLWAPPAVLTVRFPGFGKEFKSYIARYKHIAPIDVIVNSKTAGEVIARKNSWNPILKYNLSQEDTDKLKNGLAAICRIFEAAGASSLLPGLYGVEKLMKAEGSSKKILEAKLKPQHITVAANHIFGTTRMGPDPKNSVVDLTGKTHDLDDLYIVDTGIMPCCTAVNPMFTVMAIADKISQGLKQKY